MLATVTPGRRDAGLRSAPPAAAVTCAQFTFTPALIFTGVSGAGFAHMVVVAMVVVQFSVDLAQESMSPSDVIYLQSTFNGWCGNCAPMARLSPSSDVWVRNETRPDGEWIEWKSSAAWRSPLTCRSSAT